MFYFLEEIKHVWQYGDGYWFYINFVIFTWTTMPVGTVLGMRYMHLFFTGKMHDWSEDIVSQLIVSVVVTAYNENEDEFRHAMLTLRESMRHAGCWYEIIIVCDGVPLHGDVDDDTSKMIAVARDVGDIVITTNNRNKRMNLDVAIREARGEILLLVDSDTFFESKTVRRLLRAFSDELVGGATTAQRIRNPQTLSQRIDDWLENARIWSSMSAMSLFDAVGCLPGRAYAVRKDLIEPHLDEFLNEYFMGRRRIAGDDRWITNMILQQGYKTVFVPDARVTTLAPERLRDSIRQKVRWARTSQYYTVASPWIVHYPFVMFIYVRDIIISFWLVTILLAWLYHLLTGDTDRTWYAQLAIAIAGMSVSLGIRQLPHLRHNWRDLWILPSFAVIATVFQVVRVYGFFTMHKADRWGTRGDETDENASGYGVAKIIKHSRPARKKNV